MEVILIFLQHFYFRYCPTINQSITVLYKKWEEKITHVKNVGHTSKFLFGIYWWTWKTTIYWKQCWNRSIKNGRILEFKMLFKKKKEKKKNTKRYHILHLWTKNLDDMIYSSWDRVWQTEIGNYGSFFPFTCLPSNPPPPKKKKRKRKNEAKLLAISSFHTVYQKPQSYEVQFLRYRVRHTKNWKNEKAIWICHHFTLV